MYVSGAEEGHIFYALAFQVTAVVEFARVAVVLNLARSDAQNKLIARLPREGRVSLMNQSISDPRG